VGRHTGRTGAVFVSRIGRGGIGMVANYCKWGGKPGVGGTNGRGKEENLLRTEGLAWGGKNGVGTWGEGRRNHDYG